MRNLKVPGLVSIALLLGFLSTFAASQEEEEARYKDTPYFSALPGYEILDAGDKRFDSYSFFNGKDATTVEGRKFFRFYQLKEGAEQASDLQITRNFANAITKMGGTILFNGICEGDYCNDYAGYPMVVGKVMKGTNELWIELVSGDGGLNYYLTIIANESMAQEVTASSMLDALKKDGRVTLYINFDTGKATIRPDSKPITDQIAEMMKMDESLELSIEGHTDNVGDEKANQVLSEARAKAVLSAISSLGIDQKRMIAVGFGESKPIADNSTEEGRAKNRRVELVKRNAEKIH